MKLLLLLLAICGIFPAVGALISNGLVALSPVTEAFMPPLIVIVGLYLLVKNVLK